MDHPSIRPPPEAWRPAHRLAVGLHDNLERFIHVEAASGVVLLATAILALIWANSPWAALYQHLWHTPVVIGFGGAVSRELLHFWVNDGLMTIFFLLVGLEIRREMHEGELSDLRRAILPIAAALGGMVAPAVIYLLLNHDAPFRSGWGIPMATDIAFAVGVLALLGKRVPPALRILLLALAVIDDIGAIIVIGLFYSAGLYWTWLLLAAGGVLGVFLLQRAGVRHAMAYVLPGSILWFGLLRGGIHPTIAGVVIGLLTPPRSWFGKDGFLAAAESAVQDVRERSDDPRQGGTELANPLRKLKEAQREAVSPVVRLQTSLHPCVAFGIMPLFALANAGVALDGAHPGGESLTLTLGVVLGLVLGKPAGILLASFAVVKLRFCTLPREINWRGVLVVGCVAGIGFTMAIFIGGLAFSESSSCLATAKLATLVASMLAGILALVVGRALLPKGVAHG